MSSDVQVRNRILQAAREQFFRFGFTKVTIDEIASDLGMSKKTIYKYFPSKDRLLRGVIETMMKEIWTRVSSLIHDDSMDFLDKLKYLMELVGMQISKLGRPFIQDVQRNAPEIWKEIDEFRNKAILNNFGDLLNEGVQKGVFRSDVNQQLLMLMYSNTIQNIINPEVLSQHPFSASDVFEAIIKVIFEGILTDKGRAKYFANQRSSQQYEKEHKS